MTDDPKPLRPNLATASIAMQEAIGCIAAALAAGEVPNVILGESVRVALIKWDAILRAELEKPDRG